MLITFKICNFLSFNEDVEFSMLASNVRELSSHCIKGKSRSEVNILKSAVIYGANASGKSNFIKAISFAKDLIVKGTSAIGGENKYFRLDNNNKNKSTKFEFEFKHNGKMYAYGIELSLKDQKIKEEWLFQLLKTTDKPIFERKVLTNGKSEIEIALKFDTETQNRFEVYKKDIKDNQLFLSEINDKNFDEVNNVKAFKDVFDWFQNNLVVISPDSKPEFLSTIIDNEKVKPYFCNLLEIFGTDIKDIQTIEKDLDKQFPTELKNKLLEDIKGDVAGVELGYGKNILRFSKNKNGELKIIEINTQHTLNNSKEMVDFEIDEESDGTQRLIDLIPVLIRSAQNTSTYLVDEIDRSLHPELTKKILETFFFNTENIESQLIVSTHESSLLDLSLLRRDEIWFVEKDKNGASQMYSLEQFKPRFDKEIRKDYLQGRFGGIPFITNVENLDWLKNN